MISRGNSNFIKDHYDWLVAAVGVLALAGAAVFFVLSLGADADAAAAEAVRSVERKRPAENGVEKPDLTAGAAILRQSRSPMLVAEIDGRRESFLASERRVKCRCGNVMVPGFMNCPACNLSLIIVNKEDETAKKVERWEAKFGVKCDDADKDGDGFTNKEEFEAGFDPTDAKDHPDYLESLKLTLPLKETYVPFVLTKATQIPTGWRCEFFDPKRKDDYGRLGRTFTATVGEEIKIPVTSAKGVTKDESTGYVLKGYEKKEELRAITAGSTMKKAVDVSVATVTRKSDGKVVALSVQPAKKGVRLTPVDVQATLVYERGGSKTYEVVTGDEIDLSGSKYAVIGVKSVGKGAELTLEAKVGGKRHVLKALE